MLDAATANIVTANSGEIFPPAPVPHMKSNYKPTKTSVQ
jgi:hypothetical protein